MVSSCGRASGTIRIAGYSLVDISIPGVFDFDKDLSLKISALMKAPNFSPNFPREVHPNLAIFLLMFIKLSLFSLFFSHASTCSPLLTCNTRREGRANVQALPSSRGDPWETVKFESCGGAKSLYLGPDPPSTLTANLH